MSYILFSEGSAGRFTRADWNVGGAGGASAGWAGGKFVTVARSLFDAGALAGSITPDIGIYELDGFAIDNGVAAIYGLGGGANAELLARLATGNVLNSTVAARQLDTAVSGFAGTVLRAGVADAHFGRLKNVEIALDNADLGTVVSVVAITNITDVRIRLGEQAGATTAASLREDIRVTIDNGKRGEVDAALAGRGVAVTIAAFADSPWEQTSFANAGSAYGDSFTLAWGSLARATPLGSLITQGEGAGETAYNGIATVLFTHMNGGNDVYDATTGVAVAGGAAVAAELATTDHVWGGSGDDVIRTGAGNDVLFGDFGFYRVPGALTASGLPVTIGFAQDQAQAGPVAIGFGNAAQDWLADEVVARIWQSASVPEGHFAAVSQGNDAAWGFFAVPEAFYLGLQTGIGVWSNPVISSDSGSDTSRNPQITPARQEVLGIDFARGIADATIAIGALYGSETAGGGPSRAEVGTVAVLKAGVVIAHIAFSGDGRLLVSSAALADGADADGFPDDGPGILGDTHDGPVDAWTGGGFIRVTLSGTGDVADPLLGAGSDPGAVTLRIETTGTFDALEFRAWGLDPWIGPESGLAGDYLVTGLVVTVAQDPGNDLLDGGAGNDYLAGGRDRGGIVLVEEDGFIFASVVGGGDTLVGGAGADTVVGGWADGADIVLGHVAGTDRIIFDESLPGSGAVMAVVFEGEASTLVYDAAAGPQSGMIVKGVALSGSDILWV